MKLVESLQLLHALRPQAPLVDRLVGGTTVAGEYCFVL